MASGKAKFLAGLASLNDSIENIYQRNRQKMLDRIAEDEIRSRIAEREATAETNRDYRQGQIRESAQKRMACMMCSKQRLMEASELTSSPL